MRKPVEGEAIEEIPTKDVVIAYASRALTKAEKNYSQAQREALGIVYGVEHFRYYLQGIKFEIKTDAEGVKFIFERGGPILDARSTRAVTRAESFAFTSATLTLRYHT